MPAQTINTSGLWEFKGFINVEFTEAEMQEYGYWEDPDVTALDQYLHAMISSDYKVTVSWSTWANMYQFSATCKNIESKYKGYVITITHEHVLQGLTVLGRVHERDLVTEKLLVPGEQLPIPI